MQTIYLDISNKGVTPIIYAKQSDVGRKFVATITDNGVPYNVPALALLSVWYDGDSGSGNYTDIGSKSAISVDGNKITIELVEQMLSCPGSGVLTVLINSENGEQVGIWNIDYRVEAVPGFGSGKAEEYYSAFSKLASDLYEASKKILVDDTLTLSGKPADAAETGNRISAVNSRVSNLARLEEGSTTGDAELIDGRVGIDGTSFSNIGTHIRNIGYDVRDLKEICKDVPALSEDWHGVYPISLTRSSDRFVTEGNAKTGHYYYVMRMTGGAKYLKKIVVPITVNEEALANSPSEILNFFIFVDKEQSGNISNAVALKEIFLEKNQLSATVEIDVNEWFFHDEFLRVFVFSAGDVALCPGTQEGFAEDWIVDEVGYIYTDQGEIPSENIRFVGELVFYDTLREDVDKIKDGLYDVDEYGNAIFNNSVTALDVCVGTKATHVRLEGGYDEDTPYMNLAGSERDEAVILGGIATPVYGTNAANKQYVDTLVGAKYYTSLSAAISDNNNGVTTNALADISAANVKVFAAENGRLTAMLLDDISENVTISIGKDIDLVLNGKTLTFTAAGAVLDISSDIVCHIYGDVLGSAIVKSGFTGTAVDLIKASAGTLHIHGGRYVNKESTGQTTTLQLTKDAKAIVDGCEIVAETADSTSTNGTTYLSMAVVMASTKQLNLRDVKISAFAGDASVGFYTKGTSNLKNCTIVVDGKKDAYAIRTINSISADVEIMLEDCEIYSTTHDMNADASGLYRARGVVQTGGVLKAKKCKIMGDAYSNSFNATCSMGIDVGSPAICFLEDCYVFGTVNGVYNEGKLYVLGGTYTGHSHGGFYFSHGTEGEAFVKDAVIHCGNYEGIFGEYYTSDSENSKIIYASFYVGGGDILEYGSNVTVYLDGCTIGNLGDHSFVLRGTSGEQNCTVNISNSTIMEGAHTIRIDNETHKLNVGIGGNITEADIDHPQFAEFTGKNYRRYNSAESVDGNGYGALREQIENVVSDEWFVIEDTVTTEEKNALYASTNISCKEIVAQVILPQTLTGSNTEWFGVGPDLYSNPYGGTNVTNDAKYRTYRLTVVRGMFAEIVASYAAAANFWGDYDNVRIIRSEETATQNDLNGFRVQRGSEGATDLYPVGTKFKVWGLKA